jgi:hypothetical protein
MVGVGDGVGGGNLLYSVVQRKEGKEGKEGKVNRCVGACWWCLKGRSASNE